MIGLGSDKKEVSHGYRGLEAFLKTTVHPHSHADVTRAPHPLSTDSEKPALICVFVVLPREN